MDVRIVGVALPGRAWGGYDNIHVGVQRRREIVDLFPGDADEAIWDLTIEAVAGDGEYDFKGPHVQGKRGERFVYLSWVTVDATTAEVEMFRRAKLMLAAIPIEVVEQATQPGARLVARLGLTGGDGGPRCAAVRPPGIEWTTEKR